MEGIVGIVILIGVLIVAYALFAVVRWAILILVLIGLAFIFYLLFIKKYNETERAIVYRMGKFNRIAGPGWSIVLPFFEKEFRKIDVRTRVINMNVKKAFTSEDLEIDLEGSFYYQIKDPEKAVLKIENYLKGMQDMIVSETRNLIAGMSLRELFANLENLNGILAERIRHTMWNWGIDVPMVQIRMIEPAKDIITAMKQKTIEAETMQATKFKAEAQKILIEAVGEGAKSLDDRALMYYYLKALETIGQSSSTKMVIPTGGGGGAGGAGGLMGGLTQGMGLGAGLGLGNMSEGDIVDAVKNKIMESK